MVKYSDWTRGNVEALLNIIGEKNARALLSGDLTVSFEEAVKALFDKHGRRIPPEGLSAAVCDPARDFYFKQPENINYSKRLGRLKEMLGVEIGVMAEQFQAESEKLLETIGEDPRIANCLNGVYLPLVLPQLKDDDLDTALEEYIKAVKKSYLAAFPGWIFHNRHRGYGGLVGQVSVVLGSRHDSLITRMRQGPVIGIYLLPLQGFSIDAAREQMSSLPEQFSLSGLDTVAAVVMYPDVLTRACRTPHLDLAALSWESRASSGCGRIDRQLGFAFRGRFHPADAHDIYSSSLLFS